MIEKMALSGSARFSLPVALANSGKPDFSFSGPKTATKNLIKSFENKGENLPVSDICASFQKSIIDALIRKTRLAVEQTSPKTIGLAGGVACNGALRLEMERLGQTLGLEVVIPSPSLCSDNAVMIAAAGANHFIDDPDSAEWKNYLQMDADPGWLPGA